MIPTILHSRKGKTMEKVKRSVDGWSQEKGRINWHSMEDFQDSETTLNDIIHSGIGNYFPTHRKNK